MERRSIRSVLYDGTELFGPTTASALESTWDLLMEARLSSYYNGGSSSLSSNKDSEFILEEEMLSKHYIMYAGDAVVSSGRYHISPLPDGKVFVSIDRFGTLLPYRGKGYAKRGLKEIIASALSQCGSSQNTVQAVVGIQAPTNMPPALADRLLRCGFVQTSEIPVVERGGVSYVTLVHRDWAILLDALSTIL